MPTPLVGLLLLVASGWLAGIASAQVDAPQPTGAPALEPAEPALEPPPPSVDSASTASDAPVEARGSAREQNPEAPPGSGPASLLTPPIPAHAASHSGAPSRSAVAAWQEQMIHQARVASLLSRGTALGDSNRSYLPGAITAGVGALAMIVGGVLFQQAWNSDYDPYNGDPNVAKNRAGLTLMPLGSVLVITGTCLFALRFSRAKRLERVKEALERLGISPVRYGIP